MSKPILQLLLLIFCVKFSIAQLLNMSARNVLDENGTQIIASITNLSLQNRENYILNEIMKGNIPNFYRNMISVTDSALIGASYKHITYYVIPDYLALGCDTDYFLCPMTPILGQIIADTLNCSLPTRKMVNQIWAISTVKMNPQTIPPSPQMTTVPVFAQHNASVWTQRQTFFPAKPLGNLVSGDKKDVIISNYIYTYPAPRRVVIYGWHYPTSGNIQPMYAGHEDTYADYSHGIRLVQNEVYVDGDTMTVQDILTSSTLYSLLSDEGVIAIPNYPDTSLSNPPPAPTVPKSFCILNENSTSVRIKITPDSNVDSYKVYTSSDGLSFTGPTTYSSTNFVVSGLTTNTITYFKIAAANTTGTSATSEILSAVPSSNNHTTLIVNGFDRASTGNTYNFIRQHGKAIFNYGSPFSSATNDAVINGLISLNSFTIADYILGEESTADETFSNSEQNLVSSFLDNGGFLFVSGAEIGWDLEHMGNTSDQSFYNNYLKAEYVFDAPNNQSAVFYEFEETNNSIFNGLGNTLFDNGTNGTYNVKYPDVISAVNGGINGLQYSNLTNNIAGVFFKGLFPNATDTGKIVNLGIPFETVYPESKRFALIKNILDFFNDSINISTTINELNSDQVKVYPNPFFNTFTIDLGIKKKSNSTIQIINIIGEIIYNKSITQQKTTIDLSSFSNGAYFIYVITDEDNKTLKIIKH